MIKYITKIGNSQGVIFDAAIMDMAHLKVGDPINVTVHDGGIVMLSPMRSNIEPGTAAVTARRLIRKNAQLFKRLS